MREFGIPPLVRVPESASLADVVFRRAGAEPAAVVLRRRTGSGGWQDVTAAQFGAEVSALARGLVAAGIGAGDRVALMSRTCYEWTLIDYACWAAGAVTVPVYETSSAEQVEWILSDSSACAVFAETSAHAAVIGSVRGRLPGLEHLWMIGGLDALASGGGPVSKEQLDRRRAGRKAADLATIIYTSGTTGRQKGCEVTHGNLLADVRSAVAVLPEIFAMPGCSTLLFLPLAHVFARIIQVGYLESGAILGTGRTLPAWQTAWWSSAPPSCSRCRGYSRRSMTAPGGRPRPAELRRGSSPLPRRRRSPGARRGRERRRAAVPAWPCGCGTRCLAGWCMAGCGPRLAETCGTRFPAARRWANGLAISSAVPASR